MRSSCERSARLSAWSGGRLTASEAGVMTLYDVQVGGSHRPRERCRTKLPVGRGQWGARERVQGSVRSQERERLRLGVRTCCLWIYMCAAVGPVIEFATLHRACLACGQEVDVSDRVVDRVAGRCGVQHRASAGSFEVGISAKARCATVSRVVSVPAARASGRVGARASVRGLCRVCSRMCRLGRARREKKMVGRRGRARADARVCVGARAAWDRRAAHRSARGSRSDSP